MILLRAAIDNVAEDWTALQDAFGSIALEPLRTCFRRRRVRCLVFLP
jgi:hypothetical protein